MIYNLVEDILRNISGKLGIVLRRAYYKRRLFTCGNQLVIAEGVFIDNPKNISIGNNVWIDKGCIFITGNVERNKMTVVSPPRAKGKISIGNNAHLGIRTILQAHGGIEIGDAFTSGSDAKIYTLSNSVRKSKDGTNNPDKNLNTYILHPVQIGNNVWVGMQSIILGGQIGNDIFFKANTVTSKNIPSNTIIDSNLDTEVRFK